jgi:limonene-1,2-epoxide hydrolase
MTRHTPMKTRQTIEQLVSAIESRDLRAVERYLHPDVVWQNVPHLPALGRKAVTELLANVLCWSDQVRWDILSSAVSGETGWYERVDRFWLAGEEHAVYCNGVFEVDVGTQTVRSVKDYVDLGEWRSRVEPVMTQLASRPAAEVVARHLDAVRHCDPVAMAADYALHAVLQRPGRAYAGWAAIADYFDTVPTRLGDAEVLFEPIEPLGKDQARVAWRVAASGGANHSGIDTFSVLAGRIVHQQTELDGEDF